MEYDYIIVGGGIAGCVVASRLYQGRPYLKIAVIEAGSNVSDRPDVLQGPYTQLLDTEVDWSFMTQPQRYLNHRQLAQNAGKALGGGSVINAAGWLRGDRKNYDAWGTLVGDQRWSYEGFLPYFRKTERHHDANADFNIHGFDGPVVTSSVTSSGRDYPLRQTVRQAWEAAGIHHIDDMNNGNPIGIGEMNDNRSDGKRQVTPLTYPLEGVDVKLDTQVAKILIDNDATAPVAVGVQLADGSKLRANQEVIVSAGAFGTPKLLLLSGIGPLQDMEKHGIRCVVDLASVGQNFHDHLSVSQFWKLRNPELGLSMGHPKFGGANYARGLPSDFVITTSLPQDEVRRALALDLHQEPPNSHPMLSGSQSNVESFVVYVGVNGSDPQIPFDGSHITTSVCLMLPTSRGSIKLKDSDINSPPLIDPNYYATEVDRVTMRWGLKKMAQVMLETKDGQKMVTSETTAENKPPITSTSTDDDLDDLVRREAKTLYHPAGSAAMGKVVDSNLQVYGIQRLRIVDASVFPFPLGCHYQACVYALAEQAADILLESVKS